MMQDEDLLQDLIDSSRYGEMEAVKEILNKLSKKRKSILSFNEYNQQSLFMCCANGHLDILQLFLPLITKEDLNIQNNQGNTILHWAALNNQLEIVKTLLANNINPLIRNHSGLSAATLAEQRDFQQVVTVILASYDPEDEPEQETVTETIPSSQTFDQEYIH